jgi:tripartite-type tricarboxylate transporter receptor subunit TctC
MPPHVTRRRLLLGTAALTTAMLVGEHAHPQSYPSKPLRLLLGAGAGSTPDLVARLVGDQLSASLRQPVVVENRPGPGGIGAMQALVGSAPDGYTLALAAMNQAVFNSYLFSKLPYDPLRDLEPISLVASNAFSIAVHKGHSANTFGELIALTKAQPGKITLGTSPAGTPPHVFAQLLTHMTGMAMTTLVPYRSGLEGLTGLMREDVHALIDSPAIMLPQVKAGTIKVLLVTGRAREPELPDVHTAAESGFPTATAEPWLGVVAPARTPAAIVAKLNRELGAITASPEIRQRLAAASFEPRSGSPEEFRKLIREEHERWGPLIRQAGIKLD